MSDVIALLKEFRRRKHERCVDASESPEHDCILGMSATEFRDANLAILVRSYLLGEDIVLASNDHCRVLFGDQYVTYLPEELMAVYQLSPDYLKRVHRIKRLCDGHILSEETM